VTTLAVCLRLQNLKFDGRNGRKHPTTTARFLVDGGNAVVDPVINL